jgi:hypothetical protein
MHSHHGFNGEFAQDRQAQLYRDAGVDGPAARHLAVNAASQGAEVAANRRRDYALNLAALAPASRLVFVWAEWRRSARVRRPGLSGA